MDIDVFPPAELPTVFRVLRTALEPKGELTVTERAFLGTYAYIAGAPILAADPQPIAADAVEVGDAHRRKRLVQLCALAVLLSRPVKPASVAYLRGLAHALDAHDPVVEVIEALMRGRRLEVRLRSMRRVMRVMLKEAFLCEGWRGVVRLFAAMALKAPVNRDRLWRFKRLGLLAEGTLGREYWKHMTDVGFGFPGEPAGIAASVAYHDVAHVLAGNDITPMGEIQQGSFQGGNRREDGFFFIQFVVLQFHQGVKITPATEPRVGHFNPVKVLWAIHRGAKCRVDMTHQWDYWPLMELPVREARERLGLLPPAGEVFA